jgi:hypothetical protein
MNNSMSDNLKDLDEHEEADLIHATDAAHSRFSNLFVV